MNEPPADRCAKACLASVPNLLWDDVAHRCLKSTLVRYPVILPAAKPVS